MKAYMHNYERSTHDLSYIWRSPIAAGTLVPFMNKIALPGDTFDIGLDCDIITSPTEGPLFGSYKVQLDVFLVPMRLYQAKLHMNALNIGRDMSKIKLPQLEVEVKNLDINKPLDNQQINPSSVFSYLGIRGVGQNNNTLIKTGSIKRQFNAVSYLALWDIYKNYYANKQEEVGAVLHTPMNLEYPDISKCEVRNVINHDTEVVEVPTIIGAGVKVQFWTSTYMQVEFNANPNKIDAFNDVIIVYELNGARFTITAGELFETFAVNESTATITYTQPKHGILNTPVVLPLSTWKVAEVRRNYIQEIVPQVTFFPLENIDKMREDVLKWFSDAPFVISKATNLPPYNLPLEYEVNYDETYRASCQYSQEGLPLKTYLSDLFNNWISTEWIDGDNGVAEVTAIDTSSGSFTIDELNLSQKIYNMLNRIMLSGGSYDDWLDAVYTHERNKPSENPMYVGGLSKELIFQEVLSVAGTSDQPLGTLAGRGRMSNKNKGGKVIVKVSEPSVIIGLVSLTPRIDYSQGNEWHTNLKSINDLHKPALDEIGYQDLISDQMAFWETTIDNVLTSGEPVFRSVGKQPAWINYMTEVNKCYSNFAVDTNQMFMTLNRRYEADLEDNVIRIKDLTTYIDPVKFNYIFADTRRDAQNFWTQIGVSIEARRKMSAKIIPNL
nr:MAG: major capsid protein [Microvirus sp.]